MSIHPAFNDKSSFPLSNRLRRLLWKSAHCLLIAWTPRPLHAWRVLVLRCFGAKLGRGCHIYPRAQIWAPWMLVCGDGVGIADQAIIYCMAVISIGHRAVISQGTHLCSGTHDYTDPTFPLVSRPITVGADAWICAEAFVHPGVTIGEGAVIGARAVVTRNMPPWTVCAGHPCVPLKPRLVAKMNVP